MNENVEMEIIIVLFFFGIRILMRDIRLEGVPFVFALMEGISAMIAYPAGEFLIVCLMVMVTVTFFVHVLDIKLQRESKKYGKKYAKI